MNEDVVSEESGDIFSTTINSNTLPPHPPSIEHPSDIFVSNSSHIHPAASRRLSRSSLFPEDDFDDQVPALEKLSVAGIVPFSRSADDLAVSDSIPSALKSVSNRETKSKSTSFAVPPKGSDRQKVAFEQADDPLSFKPPPETVKPKKANLSIRLEDEARIISGLHNAAKKQTTGSIYSVIVDVSRTGTLDIGVKDLSDNILVVSLLKRQNDKPGAGEEAGKLLYCKNVFSMIY